MIQFKLVSAPDQEIFQQRLNDSVSDLGENIAIGHIKFDTTTMPNGEVMYSALIGYSSTQEW
jgi:catechol-2,3-dioxygenase